MSLEAMIWAWSLPADVLDNATDRWVLVAHANSAHFDGSKCYPSVLRVVSMTGYSERTVQNSRKRLVAQGLLVDKGLGPDGLREFDLPGVRGEGVQLLRGAADDIQGGAAAAGGAADDAQGCREMHPIPTDPSVKEGGSKDPQKKPGPIDEVWELWQSLWADVKGIDPTRRTLEAKTVRIIRNALSLCGEAKVRAAVAGHRNSPHHLGENDRKTVYGDLRYALKGIGNETDQERIEKMARQAPVNGMMAGDTGGLSDERIRTLVDEVEQAIELPGNESIKRRGIEAKARLEQAGFRLTRQGTKVRLGR